MLLLIIFILHSDLSGQINNSQVLIITAIIADMSAVQWRAAITIHPIGVDACHCQLDGAIVQHEPDTLQSSKHKPRAKVKTM